MSLINYNVDPVAYSEHLKIGHTTLYYPLIVHGKFNNRWIHAVDCGIGANGTYSMVYADIFDQVTSIDAVISPNAHKHLDNIDNVNLISHCLYSSTGDEVTFYRPEDDPALGSLYKSFLFHNDHLEELLLAFFPLQSEFQELTLNFQLELTNKFE